MKLATRTLAIALTALALSLGSIQADAQARHSGHAGQAWHGHRHHWGPGPFWGGVGIGIGLGYYYGGPWSPGYVVTQPPGMYYEGPLPAAPSLPDPVIYPRNGQSAAQTESDRQDCNRWATTQPSAMADAGVFHSTALACMEGRGYTVK
ncbi:hypothetical protein [Piscinibacter sp.]|jgi:hypothetical protein|uniref:hypothetical protein n=1 Tax=Piscinibacter sp. TaxID=1903157 RepID=UPI00355A6FC0